MDYQRIEEEIENLQVVVDREEENLSKVQSKHNSEKENVDSLKDEQKDLQELYELTRRLRDDIGTLLL